MHLIDIMKNDYKYRSNIITAIKKSSHTVNVSDIKIIEDIKRNNPELFFWNQTQYILKSDVFGTTVTLTYMYSDRERIIIGERANKVSQLCKCQSDENTIRKIHNYLVHNISYDYNGIGKPENHNAGGVFLYNKGVCEGIGKAFQWLCHLCGIECAVIEGVLAGGAHLWNVVKINGKNYHVDVTQDIATTEKSWNKPSYMYYLVTDSEIKHDHIFSENFNCVNTEANPFYKAGKVFKNEPELRRCLRSVPKSEKLIYFKYFGSLTKDNIIQIAATELQSSLYMQENAGTYYLERTRI